MSMLFSGCVAWCVCVYLQVIVVFPAAAVRFLGSALVQVEHGAEITEEPKFRNHKLLI